MSHHVLTTPYHQRRIQKQMSEVCSRDSRLFPLRRSGVTPREGMSSSGDPHTFLTTTATVQDDSVSKMWTTYMKEAGEYDKVMTSTWKADLVGLLVFVSINPLILVIVLIKSPDRSILRNRRHIPR